MLRAGGADNGKLLLTSFILRVPMVELNSEGLKHMLINI